MSDHDEVLAALRDGCRVAGGSGPGLVARPTRSGHLDGIDKDAARKLLSAAVDRLSALQELLYADRRWSLLVVLQAMDAGGKDGTVKHVFSGVNPQGLSVVSFKAPEPAELAHDFLWRIHRALPARGMIGLFNRSHYEEVVVARVHPELIEKQRLPPTLTVVPDIWDSRLRDIAAFEAYLTRQGTRIVKIFLHIGADEQKLRLRARLEEPGKLWKFDPGDIEERARWADYMAAYEQAIAATSTADAPWYVVPADQKWFARLLVADIVVAQLEALHLQPPEPSREQLDRLAKARKALA